MLCSPEKVVQFSSQVNLKTSQSQPRKTRVRVQERTNLQTSECLSLATWKAAVYPPGETLQKGPLRHLPITLSHCGRNQIAKLNTFLVLLVWLSVFLLHPSQKKKKRKRKERKEGGRKEGGRRKGGTEDTCLESTTLLSRMNY